MAMTPPDLALTSMLCRASQATRSFARGQACHSDGQAEILAIDAVAAAGALPRLE
jgi:hypothetical protein